MDRLGGDAYGLANTDYVILSLLAEHGSLNTYEIDKLKKLRHSSALASLSRLNGKHYIERKRSQGDDARSKGKYRLTPFGLLVVLGRDFDRYLPLVRRTSNYLRTLLDKYEFFKERDREQEFKRWIFRQAVLGGTEYFEMPADPDDKDWEKIQDELLTWLVTRPSHAKGAFSLVSQSSLLSQEWIQFISEDPDLRQRLIQRLKEEEAALVEHLRETKRLEASIESAKAPTR